MNEVEVTYLTERGEFKERKKQLYDTAAKAVEVYTKTITKFKMNNTRAIISIRTKKNGQWVLQNCDRI